MEDFQKSLELLMSNWEELFDILTQGISITDEELKRKGPPTDKKPSPEKLLAILQQHLDIGKLKTFLKDRSAINLLDLIQKGEGIDTLRTELSNPNIIANIQLAAIQYILNLNPLALLLCSDAIGHAILSTNSSYTRVLKYRNDAKIELDKKIASLENKPKSLPGFFDRPIDKIIKKTLEFLTNNTIPKEARVNAAIALSKLMTKDLTVNDKLKESAINTLSKISLDEQMEPEIRFCAALLMNRFYDNEQKISSLDKSLFSSLPTEYKGHHTRFENSEYVGNYSDYMNETFPKFKELWIANKNQKINIIPTSKIVTLISTLVAAILGVIAKVKGIFIKEPPAAKFPSPEEIASQPDSQPRAELFTPPLEQKDSTHPSIRTSTERKSTIGDSTTISRNSSASSSDERSSSESQQKGSPDTLKSSSMNLSGKIAVLSWLGSKLLLGYKKFNRNF